MKNPAFIALIAFAALHEAGAAAAPDVCSAQMRRANLDFTLQDYQGHEIALNDYRGEVVLINFWATWCAPCRDEIPDLIALHEKYHKQSLVILGVSIDDPVSRLVPFVTELKISYPVLVGAKRSDFLESFGQLTGFPTSILITRDGRICARHVGLADKVDLERQIRALL